ncbi:MAG: magnesium-chelatase subunit [Promethearchaeota archaeon CR_4]|nr:MAG: magnesium-chelatase subunit [Candidatus Lokiarchaeota archaeon CR_4]
MNPEEGELRPQINDRFGLEVEVRAPENPDVRANITKMVLDFQENPREFLKKFQPDIETLRDRIQQARTLLPEITTPLGVLKIASKIVAELGIPSQRADVTLIYCARAHTALQGRREVNQEDIDVALHLVLQHRLRLLAEEKLPEEIDAELKDIFGKIKESYVAEDIYKPNREDEGPLQASDAPQPEFKRNPLDEKNVDMPETKEQKLPERDEFPGIKAENAHGYKVRNIPKDEKFSLTDIAPMVDHIQKKVIGLMKLIRQERIKSDFAGRGRRTRITSDQKGHYTAYRIPRAAPHSIAFDATIRDHLIRRGSKVIQFPIRVNSDSIKEKIFEFKAPLALYFILDASASMYKAIQQMADVILALQAEGYKKKDKISLIMFRGKRAHVLIRPTTNIHIALRKIRRIRGDSYTPMAQGLRKAIEMVNLEKHKDRDLIPVIIICSDCGANISEKYPDLVAQVESDYNVIVEELRDIGKELARRKIKIIVIEPRKAWSTKYVGVHPGSANAIKDNFRRFAKADIYEYDAWNPQETIICLKRQL